MSSHASDELSLWQNLLRRPSVTFGLVLLAIIIIAAVFANWVAPFDPAQIAVRLRLQPTTLEHWFGTDELGRDVFSRLVYAGRVSLAVGAGVAILASVFGVILGLLPGYFRNLDAPISRLLDAMMAFPDILLAIALVATLGDSLFNVILALSIVYTPRIARTVRASAIVIRELTYVEAAHALGTSTWRILSQHFLRNMVSPMIVQATFIFAYAMLAEAGLSFLGVGVDPATPTWGTMINAGRQYFDASPWLVLFPSHAITLSALALQLIGDGLRDALDPRLSKEV